jgi:hypothetical protein
LLAVLLGGGTPKPHPLAVSGVAVHASAGVSKCPRATWTFTADVTLNGSPGKLAVRWLRPDGRPTAQQTLTVASGERAARVELRFAVTGSRPLHGSATLQILAPTQRQASSAAISYICPSG